MYATPYITLPEAPSSNRYWRRAGHATIRSPLARDYIESVRELVREQLPQCVSGPIFGKGVDVVLEVYWYRGRRAGDLSNRVKILEDALQGLLYEDDKQISRGVQERFEDKEDPRMVVRAIDANWREGSE